MARRYNNKRIIKKVQTVPPRRLLPGMIVTFNYSEQGVMDPRPILLYLNTNPQTQTIEGLNMNYLNPTKLKKLFAVTDFKKAKVNGLVFLLNQESAFMSALHLLDISFNSTISCSNNLSAISLSCGSILSSLVIIFFTIPNVPWSGSTPPIASNNLGAFGPK